MNFKITLLLLFTFLPLTFVFAQGEIEDYSAINFTNEQTYGLELNSNGITLNYRYGKRINGFNKRMIDINFTYLRHEKEKKREVINSIDRFSYGKANTCFLLQAGTGRQTEVFAKQDRGGISVRYYYHYGATLAILKPIYYDIDYGYGIISEKFNSNHHYQYVTGTSSFFKGIDEVQFLPGGYVSGGLIFEFSKQKETLSALEVGTSFNAFPKPVEIMAIIDNPQFVLTIFVAYRFGKIIFLNE